jgi:bifunctional ADP-heptose synthase (sugar kinase/adenylyltransferase)
MKKREKIFVTCGTFDPLSLEDLIFLRQCKEKSDWLIVGVHSDWWVASKQGGFMEFYNARQQIIKELKCVDEVVNFNDSDGTVCDILNVVKYLYPNSDITYVSEEDMKGLPETKIKGIKFEKLKIGEW